MPRSAHRPTPKTHKLVADQIRAGSPLASIAATLGQGLDVGAHLPGDDRSR
jgi:hypothetical protein